jgi:hypothetical protein
MATLKRNAAAQMMAAPPANNITAPSPSTYVDEVTKDIFKDIVW